MLPPSPPSPPSGPPYGTYFSRRKLTQPAPPSPPLTKTSISSTNMPGTAGRAARRTSHRVGGDAHVARIPAPLEPHIAVHLREERVIGAEPHVRPGPEPRAALTDEDGAARHELAGEALHTEHLCVRIPSVPRATDALLVSHFALDLDRRDTDRRRRLAVTAVPAIVLPSLELHDRHLPTAPLGHDLARDLRPAQRCLAGNDLAVTGDEQDGSELDSCSLFSRQLLDRDELSRRYAVLLASGRDHGFHGLGPFSTANVDEDPSEHRPTLRVNLGARQCRGVSHRLHVVGELLANEEARAMYPRLHRGQTDTERFRDVGVRQALHVVKDERGAVVWWQPVDRSAQHAAQLALQGLLVHPLGPVGHRLEMPAGLVERRQHIFDRDLVRLRSTRPKLLIRGVGGDAVEPAPEGGLPFEGRDLAGGRPEGVLGRLLRVFVRPRDTEREPVHAIAV